ncbi:hypothetical protein AB0M47_14400 [Hamadaea sp. NPDC051192]|uniref:WXG100 family type VII secretion target n=1 Tax=Hamadaea sp. NPDC051192 TaxID=3154940 RepID=UPI0034363C46
MGEKVQNDGRGIKDWAADFGKVNKDFVDESDDAIEGSGKHVSMGTDDPIGDYADQVLVPGLAAAGQILPEFTYFIETVKSYIGDKNSGIIGYRYVVEAGFKSYGKAAEIAAKEYGNHEEYSRKELSKLDKEIFEKLGIKIDDAPGYTPDTVTVTGLPAAAGRTHFLPPSVSSPGKPSDWRSMDYTKQYYTILSMHDEPVFHIGTVVSWIGLTFYDYAQRLKSRVSQLGEGGDKAMWIGDAHDVYADQSAKTVKNMEQWNTKLHDLEDMLDRAAWAIRTANNEAGKEITRFNKAVNAWADIYNEKIRNANKNSFKTYQGFTIPEFQAALSDHFDDERRETHEALAKIGEKMSQGLLDNTKWDTPDPYEGLMLASEAGGPAVDPTGGNKPKLGAPNVGAGGGGGGGAGGGGGGAPQVNAPTVPTSPKNNARQPVNNGTNPNNGTVTPPTVPTNPGGGNPGGGNPGTGNNGNGNGNGNGTTDPDAGTVTPPTIPTVPGTGGGTNGGTGGTGGGTTDPDAGTVTPPTIPTVPGTGTGGSGSNGGTGGNGGVVVPPTIPTVPTLPGTGGGGTGNGGVVTPPTVPGTGTGGTGTGPGGTGNGGTGNGGTPGTVPILPGGGTGTTPGGGSWGNQPWTPDPITPGVSLDGRNGLGGGGLGGSLGSDPFTASPVTPIRPGVDGGGLTTSALGGGGGDAESQMYPPMMPPMGGAGMGGMGGGGGGGAPRATRRGGPRLVDSQGPAGKSVLSGRAKKRRAPEPTVEIEQMTDPWLADQTPEIETTTPAVSPDTGTSTPTPRRGQSSL